MLQRGTQTPNSVFKNLQNSKPCDVEKLVYGKARQSNVILVIKSLSKLQSFSVIFLLRTACRDTRSSWSTTRLGRPSSPRAAPPPHVESTLAL